MSKHSPSPWTFAIEDGGNFALRDADKRCFQCDERYYPWVSKNIADWHLMAAAPDLLAVLQEIDSIDGLIILTVEDSDAITKRVRAAIAKATGEPS